jgi:uncharacterized membrane protein YfcA
VGVNALTNLVGHWRRGSVKWPCATAFAVAGVLGAAAGSTLGKNFDGQLLMFLFAFVMVAVGVAMLRPRSTAGDPGVRINPAIAARLLSVGFVTGLLSGFFGIGGGFLIVPGMMLGSGMPILNAIGSSLFAVSAFGFTTAASYASAGLIDWSVAMKLVAGGVVGGALGVWLSTRLAGRRRVLERAFAGMLFAVAAYVAIQAGLALAARPAEPLSTGSHQEEIRPGKPPLFESGKVRFGRSPESRSMPGLPLGLHHRPHASITDSSSVAVGASLRHGWIPARRGVGPVRGRHGPAGGRRHR